MSNINQQLALLHYGIVQTVRIKMITFVKQYEFFNFKMSKATNLKLTNGFLTHIYKSGSRRTEMKKGLKWK